MLGRKKRGSLKPHSSSILLHIQPILSARNIVHPAAYLIKIGIGNNVANKMLKGEAVQINLRQLTVLCLHLNCTPNDLFALRDMNLPTNHQLQVLPSIGDVVANPNEYFKEKSLSEIKELITKKLPEGNL